MSPSVFLAAAIIAVTATYCNWRQESGHYQYPLHLDIDLAANFGEVREDHFHMGLDFRTLGRENLPVYAADDGYVSRITVSEDNYGNAIYVSHANGTTTLYGHLNRLIPELQEYLRKKQYESKSWQQDIKIAANKFNVTKNQLIAYSGNTGYSEGPHLHFEIIDTKTGNRLNPLRKGMAIGDHLSPTIRSIYWYDRRYSVYKSDGKLLNKIMNNDEGRYRVSSPLVSLGIEATDKNAATRYTLGIYKAELYMDDILKHHFSLDEISEKDTRYVNGCVDYEKMQWLGQRIQYLFTLPGNHLKAYQKTSGKGALDISDGKEHNIRISVLDAAGNNQTVRFTLQFVPAASPRTNVKGTSDVSPNRSTNLRTRNSTVFFGSNTFYDTVALQLSEEINNNSFAFSPLIKIQSKGVPVHDKYKVSIATSLSVNDPLRKRTVMMLTSLKDKRVIQGTWAKNSMSGAFDELGAIQLIADTEPPLITLKNVAAKGQSQQSAVLRVACSDNLGTIASFYGELDGRWVPFAKKKNMFTYLPDRTLKDGKHQLKIIITDVAGNTTTKIFTL